MQHVHLLGDLSALALLLVLSVDSLLFLLDKASLQPETELGDRSPPESRRSRSAPSQWQILRLP